MLWPRLATLLPGYPDLKVEIFIDHSFTDIAAERFDAGVRAGREASKGHDRRAHRAGHGMVPVAARRLISRSNPAPQTPLELVAHRCINLRLSTSGGLYAWEFEKDGRPLRVRVDGQWTFNTVRPMVEAALAGYGIAFVPEDTVRKHVESGALV